MAARSQWKGFLNISLVSVPVMAFNTTSAGAGIRLNQLHEPCKSRVKYQKTCPIHGEISNDQIVSGYEYSKNQYVVIDTDELDKLRTEDDKAIRVDSFISPDAVDPIYLSGRHYFLVPDGPLGQKAYHVIHQAMNEANRYAIAQVVMNGKEQLVMIRPMDGLFVMSVLDFDSQVSSPSAFADQITPQTAEPQELQLAKTLVKSSSANKFDLAKYKDIYTEKLTKLIEVKVAGEELVSPPPVEKPQVINLMDALKKSISQAAAASGVKPDDEPAEAKPPRKTAASKNAGGETRKKKSS